MKKILLPPFIACLAGLLLAVSLKATIIEGFTPTGDFTTVQVTADGRLLVSSSSGVAQGIFFISSQPVNAYQASTPWVVSQSTDPWVVTTTGGVAVTVSPSTAATMAVNAINIPPTSATVIRPAAATRKAMLVCNNDTPTVWVGGTLGVTDATGMPLYSGSCFSPDNGTIYVGPLYGYATAQMEVRYMTIAP